MKHLYAPFNLSALQLMRGLKGFMNPQAPISFCGLSKQETMFSRIPVSQPIYVQLR